MQNIVSFPSTVTRQLRRVMVIKLYVKSYGCRSLLDRCVARDAELVEEWLSTRTHTLLSRGRVSGHICARKTDGRQLVYRDDSSDAIEHV